MYRGLSVSETQRPDVGASGAMGGELEWLERRVAIVPRSIRSPSCPLAHQH